MARRNHEIGLADASPGMVLSDDLLDANGQVLLPGGTVLSETNIAGLHRRGIDTLPILGEEVEDASAADLEQQKQRLDHLFRRRADGDMASEILRQFITRFRLGTA
jgi:hypothetical protein